MHTSQAGPFISHSPNGRIKRVRAPAHRFVLAVLAVVIGAPAGIGTSAAQEAGQTTDDPRRVPIPPVDDANAPVLVLQGGTLISGGDGPAVEDAVVVIRGDRIIDVGSARDVTIPNRPDRVIDVDGLYVMPGLIDAHMHFTQFRQDDFNKYRDTETAAAIRGTLLLGQFLGAGITAVRDVGTTGDVALRIKEAVERGLIDGPRVFWSGQMIATRGGHGDEITAVGSGKTGGERSDIRVANGPWDWRVAVREQVRQHADWIKLMAPYTSEEVAAAVDEAHMHGIPVAVDSFGKYSLWAAQAGVDSIEHPLDLSLEVIDAMAESGTAFVPTLTAFYNLLEYGYPAAGIPRGGFYYTMSRRFGLDHEHHLEMVKAALDRGVVVGVGTDIPFENERRYPDDYYVELRLLKDAGFTNLEILKAATSANAQILKMGDRLGTVSEGMLADLLVLGSDPLADIQNVRDVRFVIADGRVVREPAPR
jgi:imidazolonepropionase-like amidohydrolase